MKTMLALVAALALPSLALADDSMKKPADTTGSKTTGSKTTGTKTCDKTTMGDKSTAKLADEDAKLVAHIHHVNMMEIDMGKMAQTKGTAPVKKYGQKLQKDHADGDKDLTAFAKKKGMATIPADAPTTDAEKKEHEDAMAKMADLKKLKGAEFDRQFLMMMQTDHDKKIVKLDGMMPGIKDTDLATKMKDL